MFRKLITAATGAAVIAGSSLLVAPVATATPAQPPAPPKPMAKFDPKAASEPHEAVGHRTSPGQPYAQNPQPEYDWLGSYLVNGKQVWCVQFALTAPNTDEEYRPGDPLGTKWGEPLKPAVAANISYLLLRYGETKSPDEAAALAHLLHSWTAAPRTPQDLDPGNSFETIGYNIEDHFNKLPKSAQKMVNKMRTEAKANRGPWTANLTAPQEKLTIGQSSEWTLRVQRPQGKGIGDVPVKLNVKDAKVEGLGKNNIVRTPENGAPLTLKVTPTGPNPKITGKLSAPADQPFVQQAVNAPNTTQRVVSTGGEKSLSVQATSTAVTAPGVVHVGKVDAESKAGIQGVALRLTGADRKSPAVGQNGKPLVGPDNAPVVLTTGEGGLAAVPNLRTPQEVCVTEVAAAPGYEQAFDPAKPPSACGRVTPGSTLKLSLSNKANTPSVPIVIPAGDGSTDLRAHAEDSGGSAGEIAAVGGLAFAGIAFGVGIALRRRAVRQ